MTPYLEIEDGNPIWLSHDIWLVPGDDPEGPPGAPVRGRTNFAWIRAHNKGQTQLDGVRIEVFWADPSTTVLRSTANLIGHAFVDLAPGTTAEVLVLTPWVPMPGHPAHVCLLAQALHPLDPLPNPLPADFQVATHRQVAQRNVTVVSLMGSMAILPITLGIPARSSRGKFALSIQRDDKGLSPRTLATLGLGNLKLAMPGVVEAVFVPQFICERQEGRHRIELDLAPGELRAVHVQFEAKKTFEGYAALHVVEEVDGKPVGGVTYILTSDRKSNDKPRRGKPA
jgi:hypothetical protein